MFNYKRRVISVWLLLSFWLILAACGTPEPVARQGIETMLSEQQLDTLNSLEKVDDFPLYTMHYYGAIGPDLSGFNGGKESAMVKRPVYWGCSLFAALGDTDKFYGRNFDWETSPALLLFNHPADGYASVSMVDIAYLGVGDDTDRLTELPLELRLALLNAPALPFDGMNERGLAVGMAAVPAGNIEPDPAKETIDSLLVIRKMLDQAATVDEAAAILQRYNIDWGSGPAIHYLIADQSGRAVLAEFYQGEWRILPNDQPWHRATNFLLSAVAGSAAGHCARYDQIEQRLATTGGKITNPAAMRLLQDVAQVNTQWSVVYGMTTGAVTVTMGRQYDHAHTFQLGMRKP